MSKDSTSDTAAAQRADYVRALREEREGYIRLGKTDRAKQVDAQLKAFGEAPQQTSTTPRKTTQTRKG